MKTPTVAIIGRPNVGKSTLFNRLIGRREAIVDPRPGVTRDRNFGTADWNGRRFWLVDTGGLVPGASDALNRAIRTQVEAAVAEGDVLLSPQSQVEADIRAQNVVIAGRFKGSIEVKGRAELARGGRVDGDITSKTLVVEEGGIFQGQSIMDQQTSQPAPAPTPQTKAQAPVAEEAKV